jgi:starch synthase
MACGIPVVASRSGALPETVEDGVTGVLVDQGDIAGLARGFDRYAHDRSLRVAHGTNARRRCEHEYGLGKAASRYLQLVDSLIARGASTGTTA